MREDYRLVREKMRRLLRTCRLCIQQYSEGLELHHGQMPLLKYVSENRGCTQHDAARALGVSEPAVAISVKRLEKSGMLRREHDSENMRCNRLMLTERGSRMTERLSRRFDELDAAVLDRFDDEELRQLCGFLDRMTAAVSDELTMRPAEQDQDRYSEEKQ